MIIDSNANKKGQELEEGRGKEEWEMENNWWLHNINRAYILVWNLSFCSAVLWDSPSARTVLRRLTSENKIYIGGFEEQVISSTQQGLSMPGWVQKTFEMGYGFAFNPRWVPTTKWLPYPPLTTTTPNPQHRSPPTCFAFNRQQPWIIRWHFWTETPLFIWNDFHRI